MKIWIMVCVKGRLGGLEVRVVEVGWILSGKA